MLINLAHRLQTNRQQHKLKLLPSFYQYNLKDNIMKVKRLELLQALKFVEKDVFSMGYEISSRAKDRTLTIYTHLGKRYSIDCDVVQETFIGIGCAIPKLLQLLPKLDTEYFDFEHIEDKLIIKNKTLQSEIGVGHIEHYIDWSEPVSKGNFIVQLDEQKISILKKAKPFLSSNEYTPELCNFNIRDCVLYATDGMKTYSNKFNCSDISLPSYLGDSKYNDCRIYRNNDCKLFIAGKNFEMKLDNAEPIKESQLTMVKEICSNKREDLVFSQIELDAQRLRHACTIALIADSAGRFVLNLKSSENVDSKINLEILNEDLTALIHSDYSFSDIDTYCMINAKSVLLALDTLQIPSFDCLRCTYSAKENKQGFYLHTKLKDEIVVLFIDNSTPEQIQELKVRIDAREERFIVSGWERYDQFRANNYKTREEVEFEETVSNVSRDYESRIKSLIPIREDLVLQVQEANVQLEILNTQYKSIVDAYDIEFAGSKNGKLLLESNAKLDSLRSLEVSEEISIEIETLVQVCDSIYKKYNNAIASRTKFLSSEMQQLRKLVLPNSSLLEVNIDQVVNSNSHILIERAALEKEYEEFLANPKLFIKTTKQVHEEIKQKKGKKVVAEVV